MVLVSRTRRRPASRARVLFTTALGLAIGLGLGYVIMGAIQTPSAAVLQVPAAAATAVAAAVATACNTGTGCCACAGTSHAILETRGATHYGHDAPQQDQQSSGTAAAAAAGGATAAGAAAAGTQAPGSTHTLCTSNGSPYQNYQLRIAYATYKLIQVWQMSLLLACAGTPLAVSFLCRRHHPPQRPHHTHQSPPSRFALQATSVMWPALASCPAAAAPAPNAQLPFAVRLPLHYLAR